MNQGPPDFKSNALNHSAMLPPEMREKNENEMREKKTYVRHDTYEKMTRGLTMLRQVSNSAAIRDALGLAL